MEENNVVTTEQTVVEQTEPEKTEPVKAEKPVNAEVDKLKAALSKANSEAAEYKRQLREKQSTSEREAAERAEKEKADAERLAELERIVAVTDYEKKCLALNFEPDLAAQTANALADGNMDAMFDCLKAFVEATTTRLNNEALNRQPGLSAGTPPNKSAVVTQEENDFRRWMRLPPR